MLTYNDKLDIRDLYDRGYAVEEIAETLDLDECEVLDYVDGTEVFSL